MIFKQDPYKLIEVEKHFGFTYTKLQDLEVGDIFRIRKDGELLKRGRVQYKHRHKNETYRTWRVSLRPFLGNDGIWRVGGIEI